MAKSTTGEFMATLRKANGYTQQEVAEKLNISNRTLSSWETDRTLPDVLMLPVIADLYSVTVDELLRGERSNGEKSIDISENSLKNLYKNKYGSFTTKRTLILGIALICAAVFMLACALSLWTNSPAWLDWLMLILGIVGLCACIAAMAYIYNNVKMSVGVVLDEDLTDDKKAFVTTLRHNFEIFLLIVALPFFLFAIITLIIFIAADPISGTILGFTFYIRKGYIFIISINFALSVILFAASIILKAFSVKIFYSETQKSTAKANGKLFGKIVAFGCIPVAVVILLNIVLPFVFPYECKTLYKKDNFEEFRTHMHTLTVGDQIALSNVPEGEYYLPFPDELPPNDGTEYYLGNGMFATYNEDNVIIDANTTVKEKYWAVTDCSISDKDSYYYIKLWVYEYEDKYVANARYEQKDRWHNDDGSKAYDLRFMKVNGTYRLMEDISDTLIDVAVYTLTIIPVSTIVTCIVIYTVKRKKQRYSF